MQSGRLERTEAEQCWDVPMEEEGEALYNKALTSPKRGRETACSFLSASLYFPLLLAFPRKSSEALLPLFLEM